MRLPQAIENGVYSLLPFALVKMIEAEFGGEKGGLAAVGDFDFRYRQDPGGFRALEHILDYPDLHGGEEGVFADFDQGVGYWTGAVGALGKSLEMHDAEFQVFMDRCLHDSYLLAGSRWENSAQSQRAYQLDFCKLAINLLIASL
jgi:hypothetical protein